MAFLDETGLQTLWTKIKNTFALKTHSHSASQVSGLSTVASTGSYNDLLNKPTIPQGVIVDSALNSSSTNPVQNQAINSALATKVTASQAIDAVSAAGYVTDNYVSTYVAGATVTSAGTATNATNVAGTAGTSTLSWNTDVTLYTVGGNAIKAKLPANPNTNTTYTFTSGDANGQIKVTPSGGTAQNVSVKGLGTAAYTASGDYVQTGNVNQTVSGTKTFVGNVSASSFITSSTANPMLQCTWSDVDITATSRSTAGNKLHTCVLDKNGVRFGGIESTANTDGSNELHFTMRNHANNAWLNDYYLKNDASGNTSAIINNNLYCKSYLHVASSLYVDNGYIYATDSAYTKGTKPSSDNYLFQVLATDKNGTTAAHRLGAYQVYIDSSGNVCNEISVYKNISGSAATGARLRVWYISSTDTGYATINDHPAAGDSSYKLATTGWVTNATVKSAGSAGTITTTLPVSKGGTGATTLASAGIITSAGAQTLSGEKSFSNTNTNFTATSAYLRKVVNVASNSFPSGANYLGTRIVCSGGTVNMAGTTQWWSSDNTGVSIVVFNPRNTTTYQVSLRQHSNTSGYFEPTDGALLLGRNAAGYKWAQLVASTTTISTSDERYKSNIKAIPDNILDTWGGIQWTQYQLNDAITEKGEDKARIHTGVIAQQIDSSFKEKGIDISRYGLFCHDVWPAEKEVKDDEGNIISPASEASDDYAIRYEEALCMEAAYQRRRADRAEARISTLEEQIAEIKSLLGAK